MQIVSLCEWRARSYVVWRWSIYTKEKPDLNLYKITGSIQYIPQNFSRWSYPAY